MIYVRKAAARGCFDHGWLQTCHTFSFGDYYDPEWMGFSSLRVINDDRVAPGHGFPTHGHRDMEIITYVLDGALEHKDSMGGGGIIAPGEIQYMSAGSGVQHSEFNPSPDKPVHLLQIWIVPDRRGYEPEYAQKEFGAARNNALCLLASGDGRGGSLRIRQDADVYAAVLSPGQVVHSQLAEGRSAWLHVARGDCRLGGEHLSDGDGAAIEGAQPLAIEAAGECELLYFDMG